MSAFDGNVYSSDLIDAFRALCEERMADGSCMTYEDIADELFGTIEDKKTKDRRVNLLRYVCADVFFPEKFLERVGGEGGGLGLHGKDHTRKGGVASNVAPPTELIDAVDAELNLILSKNNRGCPHGVLVGRMCKHEELLKEAGVDTDASNFAGLVSAAAALTNKYEQKKAVGWVRK